MGVALFYLLLLAKGTATHHLVAKWEKKAVMK